MQRGRTWRVSSPRPEDVPRRLGAPRRSGVSRCLIERHHALAPRARSRSCGARVGSIHSRDVDLRAAGAGWQALGQPTHRGAHHVEHGTRQDPRAHPRRRCCRGEGVWAEPCDRPAGFYRVASVTFLTDGVSLGDTVRCVVARDGRLAELDAAIRGRLGSSIPVEGSMGLLAVCVLPGRLGDLLEIALARSTGRDRDDEDRVLGDWFWYLAAHPLWATPRNAPGERAAARQRTRPARTLLRSDRPGRNRGSRPQTAMLPRPAAASGRRSPTRRRSGSPGPGAVGHRCHQVLTACALWHPRTEPQ